MKFHKRSFLLSILVLGQRRNLPTSILHDSEHLFSSLPNIFTALIMFKLSMNSFRLARHWHAIKSLDKFLPNKDFPSDLLFQQSSFNESSKTLFRFYLTIFRMCMLVICCNVPTELKWDSKHVLKNHSSMKRRRTLYFLHFAQSYTDRYKRAFRYNSSCFSFIKKW